MVVMADYELRSPTQFELGAVQRLRQAVLDPAMLAEADAVLDFEQTTIHRAAFTEGGTPVSTARLVANRPGKAMIDNVATDPQQRRQGLATRLILDAEEEAMRRGVRDFSLISGLDTVSTFAGIGYVLIGDVLTGRSGAPVRRMQKRVV